MHKFRTFTAALAAAATLALALPAQAQSVGDDAEKLRRLDIMLMVTGLRCRTGANDFRADFQAFEAAHLATLNGAAAAMKADLVARHGAAGAARALDRVSTGMANQYGQGHPWLDCADLKAATQTLARTKGRAALVAAADELLDEEGGAARIAWARR